MPDTSDNDPDSPPAEFVAANVDATASTGSTVSNDATASLLRHPKNPETPDPGDWGQRMRAKARKMIEEIISGRAPRNSGPILQACQLVLRPDLLPLLTDEELLHEVQRRTEARKAAADSSGKP